MRIRSELMAERDSGFWAAMLIGFYSFFRKSNLVPKSAKDYDPSKTVTRGYYRSLVGFSDLCAVVQDHPVQTMQVPHTGCPPSLESPLVSGERHLSLFPAPPSSPAFLHFRADHATPITHSVFTAKLRKSLSLAGLQASNYSGHSFRRGGATYTFRCGAPIELISLQGDWSSDAVLLYIAQPLERRLSVAHLIAKNIISSST